jgi:opacity protein-like surface antigen
LNQLLANDFGEREIDLLNHGVEKPYSHERATKVHENTGKPFTKVITVLGGGSLLQTGKINLRDNPFNVSDNFPLKDNLKAAGAVRFGLEFNDLLNDDSHITLTPSLNLEFLYIGGNTKAASGNILNTGVSGTMDSDLDIFNLCVLPIVKLKLYEFSLYGGAGIGGAFIRANNLNYSLNYNGTVLDAGSLKGTDDTGCFSYQALAGFGYNFAKNFSLLFEYKFLGLVNPNFSTQGNLAGTYDFKFKGYGENCFLTGISYRF